jgi:hypothetical protein
MTPSGYRIYTGNAPEVSAKAQALLSQDYGYQEPAILDGKELLFVVETHTWYGSQPNKPPSPHKGVTVYEKTASAFPSPSPINSPLLGIVLIGLGGYVLWRI